MKREYTVVSGKSIDELVPVVNWHLGQGWVCQGGLICIPSDEQHDNRMVQALVRDIPDVVSTTKPDTWPSSV